MERRTSTDIRTWFNNGNELLAASTVAQKKRKGKRNTNSVKSKNEKKQNQLTLFNFYVNSKASMFVNNWYDRREQNDISCKQVFVNITEYS